MIDATGGFGNRSRRTGRHRSPLERVGQPDKFAPLPTSHGQAYGQSTHASTRRSRPKTGKEDLRRGPQVIPNGPVIAGPTTAVGVHRPPLLFPALRHTHVISMHAASTSIHRIGEAKARLPESLPLLPQWRPLFLSGRSWCIRPCAPSLRNAIRWARHACPRLGRSGQPEGLRDVILDGLARAFTLSALSQPPAGCGLPGEDCAQKCQRIPVPPSLQMKASWQGRSPPARQPRPFESFAGDAIGS